MKLETFYKDLTKTLCTDAQRRILIHYGLREEFLVSEFQYISSALNIMKQTYFLPMSKTCKLWNEQHYHDLSTGQHKRIRMYECLWLEIVEVSFRVILCNF